MVRWRRQEEDAVMEMNQILNEPLAATVYFAISAVMMSLYGAVMTWSMRPRTRRSAAVFGGCLAASFAAAAVPGVARAEYPSRPVTIIVTGAAGSPPDIAARFVADRLSPEIEQPVIVLDKPGAGGTIAMQAAAASLADGYTLVLAGQGPFALNPHLYARTGYDPVADFAPITQIDRGGLILAVNPAVPAGSVAELIALARRQPGKLNYDFPGAGTPPHMVGELFRRSADIDVVGVPYPGAPAAMLDLVAGRLAYTFGAIEIQTPQVAAGKIRALAVTTSHPLESLPSVPTMMESGLPGFE